MMGKEIGPSVKASVDFTAPAGSALASALQVRTLGLRGKKATSAVNVSRSFERVFVPLGGTVLLEQRKVVSQQKTCQERVDLRQESEAPQIGSMSM